MGEAGYAMKSVDSSLEGPETWVHHVSADRLEERGMAMCIERGCFRCVERLEQGYRASPTPYSCGECCLCWQKLGGILDLADTLCGPMESGSPDLSQDLTRAYVTKDVPGQLDSRSGGRGRRTPP